MGAYTNVTVLCCDFPHLPYMLRVDECEFLWLLPDVADKREEGVHLLPVEPNFLHELRYFEIQPFDEWRPGFPLGIAMLLGDRRVDVGVRWRIVVVGEVLDRLSGSGMSLDFEIVCDG
jgi:hypothetical protein